MPSSESSSTSAPSLTWQRQWNFTLGLSWGVFLVLLLAIWATVKFWAVAAPVAVCLYVVAGVGVVVAGWQTRTCLQLRKESAKQQKEAILAQRSPLSFILLGLSIAVLVMAFYLQLQEGLTAFPVMASGVVLAILGIAASLFLQSTSAKGLQPQQILEWLPRVRFQFAIVLLILGAALFISGIVLVIQNSKALNNVLPQIGGLILLGLVFVGVGLWQILSSPHEATPTNMRMLILILGGSTGIVVSLMTAYGAFQWKDRIFAGGMSTWQGENAWQLWLVVYLELAGLALMFASLFLAYGEVRKNAVLRRLLYGYNSIFMGLMLLAVLVVLNIVIYATFPYSYNWTQQQGFYSISDKSKQILADLDKRSTKVRVYALMSKSQEDFTDVENLLQNASAYSHFLEYETISPDTDDVRYKEFADYPKVAESRGPFDRSSGARGLLVVFGEKAKGKPYPEHAFIEQKSLTNRTEQIHNLRRDPKEQQTHEFRGEALLMTEINALAHKRAKPVVYFTQSNGELVMLRTPRLPENLPIVGTQLKDHLEKNRYKVRLLVWDAPPKNFPPNESIAFARQKAEDPLLVPADAQVLVIAWPKEKFTDDVLTAMHNFVKFRQGKLLIFAASNASELRDFRSLKLNLAEFVKDYGVEMGKDYIMVANRRNGVIRRLVPAVAASMAVQSNNAIAKTFAGINFPLMLPQTVKPGTGKQGFKAETIMQVKPQQGLDYLYATNPFPRSLLGTSLGDEHTIREPRSIAVAVRDGGGKPRMVVYGAADMISNDPLKPGLPYKDLATSSLAWLADRPELISIAPKKSNYYRLLVTESALTRMQYLPLGLMTLGIVGLGLGVWVVRRR